MMSEEVRCGQGRSKEDIRGMKMWWMLDEVGEGGGKFKIGSSIRSL